MRRFVPLLLAVIACACLSFQHGAENAGVQTIYVIGDGVRAYTVANLEKMPMKELKIPDFALGRSVGWKGVPLGELGSGRVVNVINRDGEIVSIPGNASAVLALYRDGEPFNGSPRLVMPLNYGCKCHWLPNVTVLEFVKGASLHIYGDVENELWLTGRTLGLYHSPEAVANGNISSVPLSWAIRLANPWPEAKKAYLVFENETAEYSLDKLLSGSFTLRFNGTAFEIPELGIDGLVEIRVGG